MGGADKLKNQVLLILLKLLKLKNSNLVFTEYLCKFFLKKKFLDLNKNKNLIENFVRYNIIFIDYLF